MKPIPDWAEELFYDKGRPHMIYVGNKKCYMAIWEGSSGNRQNHSASSLAEISKDSWVREPVNISLENE